MWKTGRRAAAMLLGITAVGCGDDTDEAQPDLTGGSSTRCDGETLAFQSPVPPGSTFFWPFTVAEELGYFEAEGLAVDVVAGGDLPETALVDNNRVETASAGGPEVIQAVEEGLDVIVTYQVFQDAVEGIYTLVDGGPATFEDLEGGTVGLASDSDLATLEVGLEEAGLGEGAVSTAVVGDSPAVIAESLEAGDIDAIAGSVVELIGIEASGVELQNIAPDSFRAIPSTAFITSSSVLEDVPGCIEGFHRALTKAIHAGLHNPDAGKKMSRESSPEEWTDEALGEAIYDTLAESFAPRVQEDVYGGIDTAAWERLIDREVASGNLDEAVDVASFLDDSLVEYGNDFDRDEAESDIDRWEDEDG